MLRVYTPPAEGTSQNDELFLSAKLPDAFICHSWSLTPHSIFPCEEQATSKWHIVIRPHPSKPSEDRMTCVQSDPEEVEVKGKKSAPQLPAQ